MKTSDSPVKGPGDLSSSLEDYLEAVLDLVQIGKVARVRDIAKRLNVGMASVSIALRALGERGLVNYDPYQVITLTEEGQRVGEKIELRHKVLQAFLTDVLGVDEPDAQANACRMEHAIDDNVLERLMHFAQWLRLCPAGKGWADALRQSDPDRHLPAGCRKCLTPPAGDSARKSKGPKLARTRATAANTESES